MYTPFATYKFLYVADYLSYVLEPLAILSKMYQKADLNYGEVEPFLTATIHTLENLKENKNGTSLSAFLSITPSEPSLDASALCTFEFKSHTIRDSAEQRRVALSVCEKFVDSVVANLYSRFADNEDSAVMNSHGNLFNLHIFSITPDFDTVSDFWAKLVLKVGEMGFSVLFISLEPYGQTQPTRQ